MIIIGVDPGIARTGYGVLRQEGHRVEALDYGCLETGSREPMTLRLLNLHRGLEELLRRYRPACLALELLLFSKNTRTAFQVGQARGVVLLAAGQAQIPVKEYNPMTVKQTVTGYGGAEKLQVQRVMQMTLSLKELPQPDDAADALAVAMCCLQHMSLERAAQRS